MPANATAVQFRAYVATTPGGTPDVTEHDPLWQVVSVRHAIGGVMEAVISFDIGAANGGRLADQALTDHRNYRVEIFAYGDNGVRIKGMFWGEIVERDARISSKEQDVYVCRIRRHHFGEMGRGAEVWKAESATEAIGHIHRTDHDYYFNPLIDGIVHYNRDTEHKNGEEGYPYYLLIDPEQGLSTSALEAQGIEAGEWYLDTVIAYFLWSLNHEEKYVKNPEHPTGDFAEDIVADLATALIDPPEIVNVGFPRRQYLPMYLSSLLDAHGYGWAVDPEYNTSDEESHIEPRIRVFTRGHVSDGDTELTLKLDAIDEIVDISNVTDIQIRSDLNNMPTKLIGTSAYKQYEVTLPLYRAWSEDDDATAATLEDPDSIIGRMWVANEGWDYTGLREDIESPDLGDQFSIRRRKAEDCLTTFEHIPTGKRFRRPPVLEYSTTDGESWNLVPEEWGYRVLSDQVGVMFNTRPQELLADGVTLRLTCTLTSDERVEVTQAVTSNQSVDTGYDAIAHYDLSNRFKYRQRMAAGDFESQLTGDAETVDDTTKIEDYLERLVKFEQQMPTAMQVQLFGVNFDYRIGDVITEIEGRNITTDVTASVPSGDERYPQVVGITWLPNQTTILELSTTATPEVV